jgi:hypothetical protein
MLDPTFAIGIQYTLSIKPERTVVTLDISWREQT